MNDETEDRKLLELGRELAEHLQHHADHRDNEALLQARRQALQAITPRTRTAPRHGGWLPAAATAGLAAFAIIMILHQWHGSPPQTPGDDHYALLTHPLMEDDAPWSENPDMLQDMDFSLWLDMADPQDAG